MKRRLLTIVLTGVALTLCACAILYEEIQEGPDDSVREYGILRLSDSDLRIPIYRVRTHRESMVPGRPRGPQDEPSAEMREMREHIMRLGEENERLRAELERMGRRLFERRGN